MSHESELKKKTLELNYTKLTIDLTTAQTDALFVLPGIFNSMTVASLSGQASIRINGQTRDLLDLTTTRIVNAAIDRIYVTNSAQPGSTLVLLFGLGVSFGAQYPGLTKVQSLVGVTALGNTPAWNPAAGKRFRLIGFQIVIAAGTTAAAACTIALIDPTIQTLWSIVLCGAALAALPAPIVLADIVLPGNGYLSALVNNPLNLSLSSALAAGGISVFAYGTEE